MSERPELFHYLKRQVLVRIQPRHSSGSLVCLDLSLDVVLVSADVSPGVGEIFGAEGGVSLQELLFRCAQTAGLFEKPDGNPGADEASFSATDLRAGIDAGEIVGEVLDDPLEELGFLASREGGQEFLYFIQPCHDPIVAE